ncbi:MAG: ScyD/ScyE family protein [Actinomycetota bacterium]
MSRSARAVAIRAVAVIAAFVLVVPQSAGADEVAERGALEFATPLFGLAIKRGDIFVADAGQGVVHFDQRSGTPSSLVAPLPGVSDIAPYTVGAMHAVTGAPDSMLYRIVDGRVKPVADLGAFEASVNPDGGEIDSNPFNVAALPGRRALVADAAANALLIVSRRGRIDWVATLPDEMVPTRNAKRIAGCPDAEPDFEFVCDLPDEIPAQPVATSVAVGPDGAYYVGELKGFPAPKTRSRIWRIEPGTRHARCGSSPACTVVGRGFTSIVDLSFARDGALHVVEFDEASWFAAELGQGEGGTVNACDLAASTCDVVAHLPLPTGVASTRRHVFATTLALVPGEADVVKIA